MISRNIRALLKVNWIKTLYFNFKYFPFSLAIKLPVFIFQQTYFRKLKGSINITSNSIHTGMIKIGPYGLGTTDIRYNRTILEIDGNIIFKGKCCIGSGSRICVYGNLKIGNNFVITGNTTIIAQKNINIGHDCLCSWDNLIMDTDMHKIYNSNGVHINESRNIEIGDHVWIGCRNTILKDSYIPSNTIIAAGSVISKKFIEENTIIGNANNILKKGVEWEV